jgi:hypothetical protein
MSCRFEVEFAEGYGVAGAGVVLAFEGESEDELRLGAGDGTV